MNRAEALAVIDKAGYCLKQGPMIVKEKSSLADWYGGATFMLFKKTPTQTSDREPSRLYSEEWYNWYYRQRRETAVFQFNTGQHSYSCAVPCIGRFSGYATPEPEVMAACLAIAQEANKRQGYLQAITLGKKDWEKLNTALDQSGFVKRQSMQTKHDGKYQVHVWEWTAPPVLPEETAEFKKRSAAAKKAWATRRKNGNG